MEDVIRQALEELEEVHSAASAQLRSLAEKRRHQEERRQRILLQLEEPGDHRPELHHAFNEADRELDRIRDEERAFYQQAKQKVDALRQQIQSACRERNLQLSDQLHESQREVDHLRDELIPEARHYLEDLEERHRSANARCLTLTNQLAASSNEVPDLSRFELAE